MKPFMSFHEVDQTKMKGHTRQEQWFCRVRARYNAFVRHANKWLCQSTPVWKTEHLYLAINEIGRLARLRLYELDNLADVEFDVNDDGLGSADFICSDACEFFYAAYVFRTEYVVWQCLSRQFTCVEKPKGIIKRMANILSNRGDDEEPWYAFCDDVEQLLQSATAAESILGKDAHSWFLTTNDERLYDFESNWVKDDQCHCAHATAPLHADSPRSNYGGPVAYSIHGWSLGLKKPDLTTLWVPKSRLSDDTAPHN